MAPVLGSVIDDYAAKAGIECAVLVPKGKIALGKLAQALVHGAKLIQVDANFDEADSGAGLILKPSRPPVAPRGRQAVAISR